MQTKTCSKCHVEKPVGEGGGFHKNGAYWHSVCKECKNARDVHYAAVNREARRAYTFERSNTFEGRAYKYLNNGAKRLKQHLGSTDGPKEVATRYLDGGDPYAPWRIQAIVKLLEEGDRQFGRGNYQLDHGVAMVNGGEVFSPNNLRPVPLAKHCKKTKIDVRIHNLRGADPLVAKASKKVLTMLKKYCTSVHFLDWSEQVFNIAENWQKAEELICEFEEASMELEQQPEGMPALPKPSMVALAKGMVANNERDMSPVLPQHRMDRLYNYPTPL